MASCFACEFESYLDGTIRSPGEKCAPTDEESVPGANVELLCPPGSRVPTGETRPATSDDGGQFEITVVHLDEVSACRLRVRRDGYLPFDESVAELGLRKDPRFYGRMFVKLRLQRSPAAPSAR
jgi:hypothetical protein